MSYVQKHKYHLIALAMLLIIAGVSWKYTDKKDERREMKKINQKIQDTNEYPISNIQYQKPTTPTIEQYSNGTTSKQITNYQLPVTSTSTALEAMRNARLDFKTKTFSGLGEFVEEIGGLKSDQQNGKYWIYYINGKSAKLGISTQIVKPGDLIEWKYGNANFTN